MRRPRPVALTGAERRALRVIEEALVEEDPELSAILGELAEADRSGRRVRRTTWIYVAVSVVVLVFGLVVTDPAAIGAGIIMLLFTPAVLLWAMVVRRWP
jgi:Flp pilus assembly protein TadB